MSAALPTVEAPVDPEKCPLLCAGRFSSATYVCDTCGYDPYGYYDDDWGDLA